jgi:hypothetical protein
MRMAKLYVLLAATSLGGCAIAPWKPLPPKDCEGLPQGYIQPMSLSTEPRNANAMRAIADATPLYSKRPLTNFVESWYSIPSRNTVLCRYSPSSGEWWNFEHGEDPLAPPKLVQHSGWDVLE